MSNTAGSAKNKKEIYLDYAALSPADPAIIRKIIPYWGKKYGNPSSLYASGRLAKKALENARLKIAGIINAKPEEIIFTSSGTEADNLALIGAARANRAKGKHILISVIEHKAVMEAGKLLAREGFEVEYIPVDKYGLINVQKLMALVRPGTILVSVMYVNNEIGMIEPIREISAELGKIDSGIRPIFHVDACQASNLLSLDVVALGADLLVINSGKVYGPLGAAILYKNSKISIDPVLVGGEQEKNLRAGTENLPAIVGFAEALEKSEKMKKKENIRLSQLEEYFRERLQEEIPEIIVNGDPAKKVPSILHVSIPYIEGESMILMLDKEGIRVSTGSACSASDLKPSHVLVAIGQDPDLVHGSIRFSMGRSTTKKDLDKVLEVFPPIIKKLKSISALTLNHI